MSRRGFRVSAIGSAAALTALTLAAAPSALAGAGHATQATSPASQSREVMLITGDVVNLATAPDGRQTASVIRAHPQGPGGVFQTFSLGRDLYVVPESAVPYLGSTLSPSLFDVTQLARQENGELSLTVQLQLRSATDPAKVPGITVTHRSGATATGRLTEASAREFGAALAAQAERDHASPTHTTGLFADVANIAGAAPLAAPRAAPRARPDFQMYTLTLNGITAAGKPDTGDAVVVYNVDNLQKYSGLAFFVNGRTKISVPAGHYAAVSFFFNFTTGAVQGVTVPQFTVSSDASSVTLDARTATTAVSVSTPRPADPVVNEVTIGRGDHLGQTGSYSFLGDSTTSFTVNPVTTRPTIGQLYYFVYSRLFSPSGVKPYTYDVEFPTDGTIPADQHYVAEASDLASVRSSYPADHRDTSALDTRFGLLPWQFAAFATTVSFTTPVQRTEYYTALPTLSWEGVYWSVFSPVTFELLGELDSAWTVYQPDESLSTTWGGQPEHPRLLQAPLFPGAVFCPACINGDTLNLLAFPYSDNSPDHVGYPDGTVKGLTESQNYDVYADGVEVTQGTGFLQKKVTLPAGTEDLRIDYDTTRSSAYFTLSTSAATTWRVRTGAAGALPTGWYCDFDLHTKCSVLPLMYADYNLPVNLLGQLSAGPVTAGIDLGHLAGAADVAVTSLHIAVSFDGGASWQPATVSPVGDGRYTVSFTVPAAAKTDGFGALRLSATDADGGSLSQTIQHAFAVAAS